MNRILSTIRRVRSASTKILAATIVLLIAVAVSYRLHSTYQNRAWWHDGPFFILNSEDLTLYIFRRDSAEWYTIALPRDVYTVVPGGYGLYPIGAIPELAKVEQKDSSFILMSVATAIGLPIDSLAQTLQWWDRLALWRAQRELTSDHEFIDLGSAIITREEQRSDGSKVVKVDHEELARFYGIRFWDKAIVDEDLSIAVYNATDAEGVAGTVSRMLENIGVRVVESSNWAGDRPTTCVIVTTASSSETVTVRRIKQFFHCTIDVREEIPERFDAQVVIGGW